MSGIVRELDLEPSWRDRGWERPRYASADDRSHPASQTERQSTPHRPTKVRPWEVIHPDLGLPFQDAMMWRGITQLLEQGVPLRRVSLRKPRGEEAWECIARLGPNAPLIYVKLQIRGSHVLLRSFHESEYDDD